MAAGARRGSRRRGEGGGSDSLGREVAAVQGALEALRMQTQRRLSTHVFPARRPVMWAAAQPQATARTKCGCHLVEEEVLASIAAGARTCRPVDHNHRTVDKGIGQLQVGSSLEVPCCKYRSTLELSNQEDREDRHEYPERENNN